MGRVPSVLPPQLPCPLSGVGAVYLGIQVITQLLSIFLLYSWWGELSVSAGPLKGLRSPNTDPPQEMISIPLPTLRTDQAPPRGTPTSPGNPARSPYTMERPTPVWSLSNFLIRVPAFLLETFP